MSIPLSCFLSQIKITLFETKEHNMNIFPVTKPSELLSRRALRRLLLCFTLQVGGAVRGGRLGDQPHPPSLLCGAAGVRPPAGTPPLQLCRSLPQIQTSLPLQGLPPRPGGAVQRLSIMTGRVKDGHKRIRHRSVGEGDTGK